LDTDAFRVASRFKIIANLNVFCIFFGKREGTRESYYRTIL